MNISRAGSMALALMSQKVHLRGLISDCGIYLRLEVRSIGSNLEFGEYLAQSSTRSLQEGFLG